MRLWNPLSGNPIGDAFPVKPSEPPFEMISSISAVAFSPDGTRLASAGSEGTVRLWNVATHQQIGDPLDGDFDLGGL